MPNRIIKESIWTSPNLNSLSPLAERHFYRILPLPDDHGCFECTPVVVYPRIYPLLLGSVSLEDVCRWQDELEKARVMLRWKQDGREYAIMVNWKKEQRIRHTTQRKTPAPPPEITHAISLVLSCDLASPVLPSAPQCSPVETDSASAKQPEQPVTRRKPKPSTLPIEERLTAAIKELRPQYSDIPQKQWDHELEKFRLYWLQGTRQLKNPGLALMNWMDKAHRDLSRPGGPLVGPTGVTRGIPKPNEYPSVEECQVDRMREQGCSQESIDAWIAEHRAEREKAAERYHEESVGTSPEEKQLVDQMVARAKQERQGSPP